MSRIDDLTRLRHMQDAAIEAMSFIENRTREDLDRDRMLALALVKASKSLAKRLVGFLPLVKPDLLKCLGCK